MAAPPELLQYFVSGPQRRAGVRAGAARLRYVGTMARDKKSNAERAGALGPGQLP